jgi:integrase
MNSSLRTLLDQIWRRRCEGMPRADGMPPQPEEPILRIAEAQITLTRACKSIGTHRLTHHDFRHLFATRCLETGIAPNIAADWMGHADGGVLVLQTYGHVRPGQAAAAASTLTF